MEKIAYVLLGLVAAVWLGFVVFGMVVAFPVGLVGLAAIVGFGLLFIKVVVERLKSKEDDYYSDNVDK